MKKITWRTLQDVDAHRQYIYDAIVSYRKMKNRGVVATFRRDRFTAFGVRYMETHDLMECMRFASAVSTLKCLKLGGRTGIPTRAQVDEFLRNH